MAQTEPGIRSFQVTDLFRETVEKTRQGMQQSLTGGEQVEEVVNLKLTIDLHHQDILEIPAKVTDILKHDVER